MKGFVLFLFEVLVKAGGTDGGGGGAVWWLCNLVLKFVQYS